MKQVKSQKFWINRRGQPSGYISAAQRGAVLTLLLVQHQGFTPSRFSVQETSVAASITALPELGGLDLSKTRFTDAGIKKLYGLRKLRLLSISSTRVTEEGIAELSPRAIGRVRSHRSWTDGRS